MKKALIFGFFIFTVMACEKPCEKPPKDYRDKWIGIYDFTTIDYKRYYFYYPDSIVIIQDTTNFIGTIEKYETNRLKIIFKPNAIEPYNLNGGTQINGLIYPVVNDSGNLIYPDLEYIDKGGFGGYFTDNEITISYNRSVGHLGYDNHNIHGIKINKK
jgi:hypothetical protein